MGRESDAVDQASLGLERILDGIYISNFRTGHWVVKTDSKLKVSKGGLNVRL